MSETQMQIILTAVLALGQIGLFIMSLQGRAAKSETRGQMLETVMQLRAEISGRIDAMAQQVGAQNTTVAVMAQRIDGMGQQLGRYGDKTEEVSRRMHDLGNKVVGLDGSVKVIERQLEAMERGGEVGNGRA